MNTQTPDAQSQEHIPGSVAMAVYSVTNFCAAHGITKVTFYKMMKAGTGPRIMKVGSRTLISLEAAAEWRRQMEVGATILPSRRAAH